MSRLDDAERRFRRAQRLTQKFWTSNVQPNPSGGSPAADPSIRPGRFGSASLWCARMPQSYLVGWWFSLSGVARWALLPADQVSVWVVLALIAFTVAQGVMWERGRRIAVQLSEGEHAELPAQRSDDGMPGVLPHPLNGAAESPGYRSHALNDDQV